MAMHSSLDFGYPWWLSYIHLPVSAVAGLLLALGYARKWPRAVLLCSGVVLAWSLAAFVVMRFVFNMNGRAPLATENFLSSGVGRVLDIGAGTGRSSVMVLEARPRATLVASDLFGESFDQHFGHSGDPQQKLLANLRAAGVSGRATIETADMRKLPFATASFDAAVSAYAMDHLGRDGSRQALAEAARVLKPGGDFLLLVFAKEPWAWFAFGPLMAHAGRGAAWWTESTRAAGFQILESGTHTLTLYILARRE